MLLKAFSLFSERTSAADGGTCGCIGFGGEDPETRRALRAPPPRGRRLGRSRRRRRQRRAVRQERQLRRTRRSRSPRRATRSSTWSTSWSPGRYGHGRHRGGFGTRRVFRFLTDGVHISSHTNRHRVKAWGLFGGEDGTNTIIAFRRKGETEWVRAREAFGTASYGKFSNIVMNEGDEMLFVTPSGGGYGDPLERDPALVAVDVADELVSTDDARADYGVVVDADGTVDAAATDALRAELRPREDVRHDDLPRGQRDAALRELRQAADRRRPDEEQRGEHRIVFCSSSCIAVFDTYKQPKYGDEAVWRRVDRGMTEGAHGQRPVDTVERDLDDGAGGALAAGGDRRRPHRAGRAAARGAARGLARHGPRRRPRGDAPARAGGPRAARGAPRHVRPRDHDRRHPRRLPRARGRGARRRRADPGR